MAVDKSEKASAAAPIAAVPALPVGIDPAHSFAIQTLPYYAEAASRRPSLVTVISLVGVTFSTLAIVVGLWTWINAPSGSIGERGVHPHWVLTTWDALALVLRWALVLVLFGSSLCCLSLKPWARKGMILYAIGSIAVILAEIVLVSCFTKSPLAEFDATLRAQAPRSMYRIGLLIGIVLALPKVGYCILTLVCMRWENVKEAFIYGGQLDDRAKGRA